MPLREQEEVQGVLYGEAGLMPEVRIVCSRIGDPWHKPSEDNEVRYCCLCEAPVTVEIETLRLVAGHTFEIMCVQCNFEHIAPVPYYAKVRNPDGT